MTSDEQNGHTSLPSTYPTPDRSNADGGGPVSRSRTSPYPRGRVIQPDDDSRTIEALLWLLRNRVRFVRKTRHHIKINAINFFPTTGRIVLDSSGPALPQRGLAALQALLHPAAAGEAPTRGSTGAADHVRGALGTGQPSVAVNVTSAVPRPEDAVAQAAGADTPSSFDQWAVADTPRWED